MSATNCQVVFNELSLRAPPTDLETARDTFRAFVLLLRKTLRLTGSEFLRVPKGFLNFVIGPQLSIRDWTKDPRVDRELRRRLRSAAGKGPYIDTHDASDVHEHWNRLAGYFDQDWTRGGLLAAHVLESIAISVDTEDCWNRSEITITLRSHDEAPEESTPSEGRVSVRHVCRFEHLDSHKSWLSQRDGTRSAFRQLVDPTQCHHVPARQYAKHVSGNTNADRQRQAKKTRNSQFLAKLDGRRITDATIEQWEKDSLADAWFGRAECSIVLHSPQTFYVYASKAHLTGYEGGSGEPVDSLRVEWSSREVHSHPRKRPKP